MIYELNFNFLKHSYSSLQSFVTISKIEYFVEVVCLIYLKKKMPTMRDFIKIIIVYNDYKIKFVSCLSSHSKNNYVSVSL